jgi:hypothetical protein
MPDFQSGDPDYKYLDDMMEDDARQRLAEGDVWAWSTVTVTAHWGSFTASASVSGCSYADEEDFDLYGGKKELENQALCRLNETLESIYTVLRGRVEGPWVK